MLLKPPDLLQIRYETSGRLKDRKEVDRKRYQIPEEEVLIEAQQEKYSVFSVIVIFPFFGAFYEVISNSLLGNLIMNCSNLEVTKRFVRTV